MRLTITGRNNKIVYQHDVTTPDDLELGIQIDGTLIAGTDAFYLDPENFAEIYGTTDVAAEVARYNARRHQYNGGCDVPDRPYFTVGIWEKEDAGDREWRGVQAWALDELETYADAYDREIEPQLVETGVSYCITHGDHSSDPDFRAKDTSCRIVPLYVRTEDDPGPASTP